MTEINIIEQKDDNDNQIIIFPDIKSKQNISQSKENINLKEETNISKISPTAGETDRPYSDKINETESSRGNKDINSKDIEKIKSDENTIQKDIINNSGSKIYFTDVDYPRYPNKNTTEKSSISKIYTIEVIPEYPEKSKVNKTSVIHENKKLNKSTSGPEIELKKKVKNKYNFIPLKHKIKELEDQMKKQNEYDYQKVIKEFQFNYEQKLKKKEREKIIYEKNEKFKNKLKQMEEIRNNLINEKWMKVLEKQNKQHNRNKNAYNGFDFSTYERTDKNYPLKKCQSAIDINYSEKEDQSLPTLQNLSRLEYIKLKKQQAEDEFCNQVLQKLQENDEIHRRNHKEHLRSINDKLLKQEKIYRQRSHKCFLRIQMKDDELKENYRKREMIKSYNIKNLIEKARYNRKLKFDKLSVNKYNVKENQEIIEKKIEEKYINYQKKLMEQNKSTDKKYLDLSYLQTDKIKKKIILNNLQKQNLKKLYKEKDEYYNDLISKQEDNVMTIQDLLKGEENIRDIVVKRTINEQIKKNKEFENLTKFQGKMRNENIFNFSSDRLQKIFDKKIIEEQKRIEEENVLFNI